MDAFLAGLEQAKANGHDLSKIGSVASFFVSRVDTEVDKRLDKIGTPEAQALHGKAAIANAQLAYQRYEKVFATDRWQALAAAGAQPQRPLWASTSTKNPAYRDVMYVEELVAPGMVNTMPEATIHAFADHGETEPDTVTGRYAAAQEVLDDLAALGIDYDDVVETLEREGVEKFEASWTSCSRACETQLAAAVPGRPRPVDSTAMQRWSRPDSPVAAARTTVPGGLRRPERSWPTRACPACWPRRTRRCGARPPRPRPTIRLGWLDTFRRSRELLPRLAALRAELAGLDHVVLAGMGGSSLAPEVIARTARRAADRARHHRPAPGPRRAGRPARPHRRGGLQQVGLHCGDRLPPPGLLAGVRRRRDAPTSGSASSWSPTRARRWSRPPARWARTWSWPTPTSAAATAR